MSNNAILGAGYFNPLYQDISSNFREGDNLDEIIERSVAEGELKG